MCYYMGSKEKQRRSCLKMKNKKDRVAEERDLLVLCEAGRQRGSPA